MDSTTASRVLNTAEAVADLHPGMIATATTAESSLDTPELTEQLHPGMAAIAATTSITLDASAAEQSLPEMAFTASFPHYEQNNNITTTGSPEYNIDSETMLRPNPVTPSSSRHGRDAYPRMSSSLITPYGNQHSSYPYANHGVSLQHTPLPAMIGPRPRHPGAS
jgi:hypothetical protein